MARLVFDGKYVVFFLPAVIGAPASPSLAACNAGTVLTTWIPKDGFNPNVSNDRVQGGDLSSLFIDEIIGTYHSSLQITAYHDDTTDTAWNVLGVYGTTGALVVVPNGPAIVGSPAYVWPSIMLGTPIPMQTGANALQKFSVDVAVRTAPNLRAVMVA